MDNAKQHALQSEFYYSITDESTFKYFAQKSFIIMFFSSLTVDNVNRCKVETLNLKKLLCYKYKLSTNYIKTFEN